MQREAPTTRTGRRRGPSKGDLREQAILDTARGLLAHKAPGRITIDDLASGAGISRPSFYFYFPSKQAVLEALLEPVVETFGAVAEQWLTTEPSVEELRSSLTRLGDLWRDHGPLLRLVFRDDADGGMCEHRDRLIGTLVANATARITSDRASGLAQPGPPAADALALMLVRLMVCTFAEVTGDGNRPVPDEVVETLTVVVGRSIYGRSPYAEQ